MVEQITDKVGSTKYADGKMLSAKDDGVGLIIFNQPAKRNAMSVDMWEGLGAILDEFQEDSSIRVVIITGAGHKAFVSGADISQFEKQRSNADAQVEYDRLTSAARAPRAVPCGADRLPRSAPGGTCPWSESDLELGHLEL